MANTHRIEQGAHPCLLRLPFRVGQLDPLQVLADADQLGEPVARSALALRTDDLGWSDSTAPSCLNRD